MQTPEKEPILPTSLDRTVRPLRVLIVEDEIRLRDLLLEVIPELGFPAMAAHSAEEARKLMEASPSDILLLDLQLPLMGGMEFFAEVRSRWPGTQVIILTGFGDMEAARRAIHLDVVDFLSKPFHLNTIEIALERARRRSRGQTETSDTPNALETSGLPAADPSDITLAENEKRQILAALARNNGNRTAAAAELGISRRTLHYRLNQYRQQS
jgi:DNA-binding NtrC family response regulator